MTFGWLIGRGWLWGLRSEKWHFRQYKSLNAELEYLEKQFKSIKE